MLSLNGKREKGKERKETGKEGGSKVKEREEGRNGRKV